MFKMSKTDFVFLIKIVGAFLLFGILAVQTLMLVAFNQAELSTSIQIIFLISILADIYIFYTSVHCKEYNASN